MSRHAGRAMVVATVGLVAALVGGGCATRGDDQAFERSTGTSSTTGTSTVIPTTTAPLTTTAPSTTTTPPTTTPPTTAPSDSTAPGLVPGSSCVLGSHPDCIDPDGDGAGTYLRFGAECMAAFPDAPELCTDLDQDGVAGYPDRG